MPLISTNQPREISSLLHQWSSLKSVLVFGFAKAFLQMLQTAHLAMQTDAVNSLAQDVAG